MPFSTPPVPKPAPRLRGMVSLVIWVAFLLLTIVVGCVWTSGFGETELLAWSRQSFHLPEQAVGESHAPVQETLLGMLRLLDGAWVTLAAIIVYSATATREGLPTARRWAATILMATGLLAGISSILGWPLGRLHYTNLLGPRVGGVPAGLPLWWLATLLGARDLLLRIVPTISHRALALGVGVAALATDVVLEPVASKLRVFWLWPTQPGSPGIFLAPAQNYAAWFLVGAVLAYYCRGPVIAPRTVPAWRSPAAVFLLQGAVLALANAGRLWRH